MRKLALGSLAAFFALGAYVARAEDEKKDGTVTVYKPYSKLDDIFDEKGGVFLPAKELQKLIDQLEALKRQPLGVAAADAPPPAPFVHVASRYKGTADESVARFEATFDFEILEKKKWVEIPLGLGPEISLEEAKSGDGKRAIVRPTKEGGYTLLVQGGGPLSVTAKFTAPIKKDRPGQRSFEIKLARAALSTFEVDLPERGLRVDVTPSLGASVSGDAAGGKTHVTAYLGSGDAPVTVTWYPQTKEITKTEKPVVFSELGIALRLDEGVAKAFVTARYTVEQALTDTFRISVPKDWRVSDVQADGKRESETTETAGGQVVRVALHERAKSALITFRLERARDDQAKFDFPIVKTLDAERETGVLAAASSSFLKLEAGKVTGLSQVDPSEIPAHLAVELRKEEGDRVPLGFRFLKNDFKLDLHTAKVEPEVEGKVFALATVKDDEITYFATIVYEIKKRGIFGVKVKLPAGLTNVDCGDETTVKSAVPRAATAAEKWDGQVLDVDFARQARPGTFLLRLTGTIARKDAAKLGMPILALDGVTKETGVVGMAAQKHLKLLTSGQPAGLIPVAVGELPSLSFPYATQENEELVFGFKYGKPGASASVDVSKREPKVTASVEVVANADLDRIKVDGDIRYKVEFAGIDHLKLRCPKELNNDKELVLTADGASIKERKCSEPDKDGKVTWDIELQSKREGSFKLHYHYEIKLTDMSAGAQRDVTLHEVEALDSSRETGDIALLKHENLVISEGKTDGLETRATRELPESLSKLGGFRGYHYVQHPWTLVLNVIKYDFQAPLGKIIEHHHLDEVVLRDGTMSCEAWIKLRNNQSQFLRVLIPVGAEVFSPVLVGGKEVTPSKFVVAGKDQSGVDIMLPEDTRGGDKTVLVRMRYAFKKERSFGVMGSFTMDSPTFPTDDSGAAGVPVARFTRNIWLPDKVCYTDFDTDMTTHFERGGLFEGAKSTIFQHMREEEGAGAAEQAVNEIHGMATSATGAYPPLEHPSRGQSGGGPRLFEKLDGAANLKVVYASWPALYGLGVLALAAVVALGAFMETKKLLTAVSFFAISAGTTFFLAVIAARSYEPFLTTAFTGSLGIGSFWFLRACWRELTVERHRRHLEALSREAEVAKARASAAEAESRAAQGRTAPSPSAPAAPKGGSPADAQGGERIGFDESLGRPLPPQS